MENYLKSLIPPEDLTKLTASIDVDADEDGDTKMKVNGNGKDDKNVSLLGGSWKERHDEEMASMDPLLWKFRTRADWDAWKEKHKQM